MLNMDRRPGIGETLDIQLTEVEEGHAVLEAMPDIHLYNPIGTVHGGFAATMLDFACGYAAISSISAEHIVSTIELKIAYHKPITKETGKIRAEGKIITMGKRVAFTEARLMDVSGNLYASATSSLMITSVR
jgi:uncharacterized protein (TIGR00369 family)